MNKSMECRILKIVSSRMISINAMVREAVIRYADSGAIDLSEYKNSQDDEKLVSILIGAALKEMADGWTTNPDYLAEIKNLQHF